MDNFTLIKSNVDVQPLLKELLSIDKPWELHTGRQSKIKVQREARAIPLRGSVKSKAMGRKHYDVHESRFTSLAKNFPTVIGFIENFAKEIDGEMSRAKLVNLPPGNQVYSHIDQGEYYKIRNRYHLILSTGPDGSYLKAGDESVRMQAGELWWFNNKAPHESLNDSDQDRIHLIFDLLPSTQQALGTNTGVVENSPEHLTP